MKDLPGHLLLAKCCLQRSLVLNHESVRTSYEIESQINYFDCFSATKKEIMHMLGKQLSMMQLRECDKHQ